MPRFDVGDKDDCMQMVPGKSSSGNIQGAGMAVRGILYNQVKDV